MANPAGLLGPRDIANENDEQGQAKGTTVAVKGWTGTPRKRPRYIDGRREGPGGRVGGNGSGRTGGKREGKGRHEERERERGGGKKREREREGEKKESERERERERERKREKEEERKKEEENTLDCTKLPQRN
jgi:hypothetical protein